MQANTDHMGVPRYPVTIVMGIAFGILAWLEWLEPQLQAGGLLVGCPNGRKSGRRQARQSHPALSAEPRAL